MKLSQLSIKDVINDSDGAKLGKIIDIELDNTGKIEFVIIHRGMRFTNLFSNKDTLQIPWSKILKIGNDVIIVEWNNHTLKNKKGSNNIEE